MKTIIILTVLGWEFTLLVNFLEGNTAQIGYIISFTQTFSTRFLYLNLQKRFVLVELKYYFPNNWVFLNLLAIDKKHVQCVANILPVLDRMHCKN